LRIKFNIMHVIFFIKENIDLLFISVFIIFPNIFPITEKNHFT
jgi:hypothetical protein